MIVIALLIASAEPSAEALALGREAAEVGMLATLMPILEADATEKVIAEFPDLDATDKQRLRGTAHRLFARGKAKLLEADGRAYAVHLSVEDLRALVAFSRTSAAAHFRSAIPAIAAATMANAGSPDFRQDVIAAFCAEHGKLCPAK